MGNVGPKVFPIYAVIDLSASMAGEPIDAAEEILPALIDACRQYASLADVLRFSIIVFSDTAQTVVPMCSYDQAGNPGKFRAMRSTNYGAAFRELRSNIDRDIDNLKLEGHMVFRPSVFFITDGEPTDDAAQRAAAWNALTDTSWRAHPNVVAFGVGPQVKVETVRRYISHHGQAFVTRDGASAADGLRSIINILVQSVVASVNDAMGGGNGKLILDTGAIDDDLVRVS